MPNSVYGGMKEMERKLVCKLLFLDLLIMD